MTFDELSDLARGNDEMPRGLPLPEQECYLALRHLYGCYRKKFISREQGNREKGAIRATFQSAVMEYARRADGWKQEQERIRAAAKWYTDLPIFARTATDAELIGRLLAIISAMVGEDVTARAVCKARIEHVQEKEGER